MAATGRDQVGGNEARFARYASHLGTSESQVAQRLSMSVVPAHPEG
jgi:hypothetical protein